MATFRTVNGKTVISSDNMVRADGFTDRERANEFDMTNHGDLGSSPIDGKIPGNFKLPEVDFANIGADIGKKIRTALGDVPIDGELNPGGSIGDANKAPNATFGKSVERDWRVKLSIPNVSPFDSAPMLQPLRETGGLVFPYTPTIIVAHSANYNAIAPTHTNYPYFAYQNSQVDQLVITGDFFVQNGTEARYWAGALHYLRSMTKMFFGGEASTIGAPPPIAKLNGYGEHIFNDVPVVITQFTIDLPQDVDYISMGLPKTASDQSQTGNTASDKRNFVGWAPSQSLITVTVQPVYSRRDIAQFSLKKYVNGGYLGDGGFI
jgi:hypothetical protein